MTVAVIGLGVIGKAQARLFEAGVTYDPLYNDSYPYDELTNCDFAVVCAPTPESDSGAAILSYVESAIEALPPIPVLLRSTVPTAGEIGGNFSAAEVAKEGNITASGGPPGMLNAATMAKYPGGIIPTSVLDPNMQALMKLYPQPNADPNSNGGYNYVQAENFNQNSIQWMSRVDYNISDSTNAITVNHPVLPPGESGSAAGL